MIEDRGIVGESMNLPVEGFLNVVQEGKISVKHLEGYSRLLGMRLMYSVAEKDDYK